MPFLIPLLAFLRRRTFLWKHGTALLWSGLALATIAFYSIPLFSRNATIHWDLADVIYPAQKFFADSLHSGKLPHWTPYLDSGIPFLAEPCTGAWYPLHWLFFAIGITPRGMFWELALHAFLAMGGAYLLAERLFLDVQVNVRGPAVLASILYAWGGFFASHSSLLGSFEAAALLPWLLWGALRALETQTTRWIAFTSLTGGLIVLAGDAPAALESLLTLICVVAAAVFSAKASAGTWRRGAVLVASVAILALMLGAIQVLPAMELHSQAALAQRGARFQFGTLATLVSADYYTLISGLYSGPEDARQYYLYSGLLLLPLAISGFVRRERWLLLVAAIVPTVIFDLAGRPPGDAWFPAALGLAMASASGAMWIETRMERPYIWIALLVLSAVDLWFWNLYKNPLVFAHARFSEIYGQTPAQDSGRPVRPNSPSRTWAPYVPVGLGPADGSLIARTEVTYGSGLAELERYTAYLGLVEKNSKLLNGLGVTDLLLGRGRWLDNPDNLGRVSTPPRVEFVADRKAALAALATLDPAKLAVVEASARTLRPAVRSVEITAYTGDSYHIKYSAASDSLLRIAVPYYPGWTATVDGAEVSVVPVDEALMGVFVPAGEHELTFQFESRRFLLGVSLSAAAGVALAIGLILP